MIEYLEEDFLLEDDGDGEETQTDEESSSTTINVEAPSVNNEINNEINIDFGKTTDHQENFTVEGLEKILKFSLGTDPFREFLTHNYPKREDETDEQYKSRIDLDYENTTLKEKFYKNWYEYVCDAHNLYNDQWLDPYSGLNIYDDAPFTIHDVIELRDPNSGLPILKDGKKVYVERPTPGHFDGIIQRINHANVLLEEDSKISVINEVKNKILPYSKERFVQECAMRLFSNFNFEYIYGKTSTREAMAKSSVLRAKILANQLISENLLEGPKYAT